MACRVERAKIVSRFVRARRLGVWGGTRRGAAASDTVLATTLRRRQRWCDSGVMPDRFRTLTNTTVRMLSVKNRGAVAARLDS